MKVELRRSFDEIARVVGVTEAYFLSAGVDPNLRTAVDLCIEELFVNMVSYNRETDSNIDLEMNVIEGGIEVSLTDYDVERFDPTERGEADVDAPLENRTPGGLGVYLVLKMVDSIHYEYHDRQSKITFQIKVS